MRGTIFGANNQKTNYILWKLPNCSYKNIGKYLKHSKYFTYQGLDKFTLTIGNGGKKYQEI